MSSGSNNQTIAILNKINELAARYGIGPAQFLAEAVAGSQSDDLFHPVTVSVYWKDPAVTKHLKPLIQKLGGLPPNRTPARGATDEYHFHDTAEDILFTLQSLIEQAPKRRFL